MDDHRDVPKEKVPEDDMRGASEEEQAETVGGGATGIVGMAAGAGLGLTLGPVGAIIGALAGGAGGWWAGKHTAEALGDFSDEDDDYYRRIHEASRQGPRTYDEVRHAYQLGHLAGRNPDYRRRAFDDVEPDLRHAWQSSRGDAETWDMVRPYVDRGFAHAREHVREDHRARDIRDV